MKHTSLLISKYTLPVVTMIVLCLCTLSAQDANAQMKVGLGETVITPNENIRMRGFARSQVSTGVHDDLHARSIVIEGSNGTSAVLMTIGLCGISEDLGKSIRSGVSQKTGIPSDNIIISCTHTHAGPSLSRASKTYMTMLETRCIESAVGAWENRSPGRIGIGTTKVMELGRNRRRLLYGGVHPDPEVGIIKIEDHNGKLRGVAFNYGCHPSALDWHNTLYSEDWPYYAIQGIKKAVGDDVWVAYYQSAQGNINVGYNSELSAVGVEMPVRTYWYIEHKGGQMSDAVLKALPGVKTNGSADVQAACGRSDYPLRESYPVTIEQAEKDAETAKKTLEELKKRPELEGSRTFDRAQVEVFSTGQRLRTAKRFYSRGNEKTISLEQQAVRIGDAAFVSFPGELFADIGLKIKQQSPLEKTFILGVTPGPGGYLPSAKEFVDEDYEVDGSRYSPKTEQVCIDSSLELINRIKD